MADINNITKEQFDAAYNKHLPNGWIKFAYKYFSQQIEMKDMILKKDLAIIIGGLLFIGFICTVINILKIFVAVITIAYSAILSALVLYLFSAVILNNLRINKIKKELGINSNEYDALVAKYY